jgi:TRAP-type C4-dicarboxylate transport system permease small subunit
MPGTDGAFGAPSGASRGGWRWFDRLIDVLAIVAGVLLCMLTVLITVDVVCRWAKWFTIAWTLDVAEYTLYVVTFFGAPWVLRERGHIAIDLFVERLKPPLRRRAAIAADMMGAVVCAVLLYYSVRVWWGAYSSKTMVYETFVLAEWWIMSVAPPTFAILLVLFIRFLVDRPPPFKGFERPHETKSPGP